MSYTILYEEVDPLLEVHYGDEICLQLPVGQIRPELREWLGKVLDEQTKSLVMKIHDRLLEEVRGY